MSSSDQNFQNFLGILKKEKGYQSINKDNFYDYLLLSKSLAQIPIPSFVTSIGKKNILPKYSHSLISEVAERKS